MKQKIYIKLSSQEKEKIEEIITAPRTDLLTKRRAHILLLSDTRDEASIIKNQEIADEVGVNLREVGRVRQVYNKNHDIMDVFKTESYRKPLGSKNSKKRKHRTFYECEHEGFVGCDPEAKYPVVLINEEREQLIKIIKSGKHSNRLLNRCKILLYIDESEKGKKMSPNDISEKLNVSLSTISRVKKIFVLEGGLEKALSYKHSNAGRRQKLDGKGEARLIAEACSEAPEGRSTWTLRLLADRLIELEIVDYISHSCVGDSLKKMNLNLGLKKNG